MKENVTAPYVKMFSRYCGVPVSENKDDQLKAIFACLAAEVRAFPPSRTITVTSINQVLPGAIAWAAPTLSEPKLESLLDNLVFSRPAAVIWRETRNGADAAGGEAAAAAAVPLQSGKAARRAHTEAGHVPLLHEGPISKIDALFRHLIPRRT